MTVHVDPLTAQTAPAAVRDVCVILNPGSGKQRVPEAEEKIRASLETLPGRGELRIVRRGSEIAPAARKAVEDGFDVVAAAGGDGTMSAVASALAGTKAAMGVVSLGTFNYFARSLGIPEDPGAAVRLLGAGPVKAIDVGEVNGTLFLNNASLGAYAEILAEREQVYRRWGRSQVLAHLSVITTLLRIRRPMTLKVTVDGEVRRARTPIAFVAANGFQLDQFGLPGADCVRNGQFALFLAPDCTGWQLLRFAVRLAFRSAEPSRDFELICGSEIVVEAGRSSRHVAHDGERDRMTSPYRFRILPEALRVVLPDEGAAEAAKGVT